MLVQMARMSVADGLVMTIHPGVLRNHTSADASPGSEPDTGHDIPVATEYTAASRPLLEAYGLAPGFHLVLFAVDETIYSRELAPLAGFYPSVYIGAPWWFLDAPDAILRYRAAVTETAGFYRSSGFIDDTRAFLSIPARHDTARRSTPRSSRVWSSRAASRSCRGASIARPGRRPFPERCSSCDRDHDEPVTDGDTAAPRPMPRAGPCGSCTSVSGRFHRAHQAWYTAHAADAAELGHRRVHRSQPASRRLARRPGRPRTRSSFADADGDTEERIDSVVAAHDGADVDALRRYLASPEVAIVTLTVTEAGYGSTPTATPTSPTPRCRAISTRSAPAPPAAQTVLGRVILGLRRPRDAPTPARSRSCRATTSPTTARSWRAV